MHRASAPFSTRVRRRVAILTTLALAAGLAGFSQANAATTIVPTPSETDVDGPVVRNDSIALKVDTGGRLFFRSSASAAYSPQSALLASSALGCRGNLPPSADNSPRSQVVVTGPAGTILNKTSPAKTSSDQPANPQPAPGSSNYLGGRWETTLSLAGQPAGAYTVTTTITNKLKTGLFGACTTGTPSGVEPTLQSWTFEYRPWQQQFRDLLGTGAIRMNTTPKEFQFDVSSGVSPIITGAAAAGAMKLYSVPNSFEFQLSMANPGACGSDPLSCLPDTAVSCNPALGCQPRLVTINYNGDAANKLTGLFDIETKAFAAVATANGRTRVLLSGGTGVDSAVHGMLDQLNQLAAQLGVDLPALLGTTVDLNLQRRDGSTDVIRISLLKAIEIFNVPSGPATGLGLLAPLSVGAGVIVHAAGWSGMPVDPAFTAADGTQHSGFGYTVTEATALPAIPSLPAPVNALVPPGKLKHVTGRIPAGSGGHTVAIGVDTDNDAASGLPLHLPLLSTPGLVPDSGIDFVGSATVLLNLDLCLPIINCLGGVAMLGTGVATFGTSPLPVNFGSLPLVWGDELGLGAVMAPIDGLVSQISTSLLSNPAVTDLLGTLPLGDVLGGGLPTGDLPVGNLPIGDLPLGSLPLGSLPLSNLFVGLPLGNLLGGGLFGNLPLNF